MSVLYCGQDHEHEAIVCREPCGCVTIVSILTHEEHEAYKTAARAAKEGMTVETWPAERVRTDKWGCDDHPDGPPWWRSRGGNGKRPKTYEPQLGLGL